MAKQLTKQLGDTSAKRLAKVRLVKELIDNEEVPLTDHELAAEIGKRGFRCGVDRAYTYRRALGIPHYTERCKAYIERLKGE